MTRISLTALVVSVLFYVGFVAEGKSTQLLKAVGEQEPLKKIGFLESSDDTSSDTEEYRFLTGSGTGASTATALNNLITRKQEMLENLRPQGGISSAGANVIVVNAGSTSTGTGSATGSATTSNANSGIAGVLLPQVINSALGGRRRRRRPSNRNRNRNRNRGNRNRSRKRGSPQVYLVRP